MWSAIRFVDKLPQTWSNLRRCLHSYYDMKLLEYIDKELSTIVINHRYIIAVALLIDRIYQYDYILHIFIEKRC